MAKTSYNPDHRGYTDLESLFRGNFDEGALHLELGKDELPPKPKVIWDVQTGHRRLCPAVAKVEPESCSTASTAASDGASTPIPEESVGPPGYRLSVAPGPNPTSRPMRHTAPGEFFPQFRRPPEQSLGSQKQRSEVLAAVNSMADEHQAVIDSILEQCDKVSRIMLLATANALRESNHKAEKPLPWMMARSHIKKELARLAGLDEVHRLLDVNQLDYPENDDILLYCSPEERIVKNEMEAFLLKSVKRFAKNERLCEFDLERVQKRLTLHGKDAEGVLNHFGHDDNGKAAQRWFKQTEATAHAALKDRETAQHKIFDGFAQTLSDTTRRMKGRDVMGTTGFSMSDTHVSFAESPTAGGGAAVFLQPEEKDMLQSLEMQKKFKEKAVWELKRQLDELIEKRRKMDEDVGPANSTADKSQADGTEKRLQKAKSKLLDLFLLAPASVSSSSTGRCLRISGVKEMDEVLSELEEERTSARRSVEKNGGPQMARMVEFMTSGQRNLRQLLDDLKRAEQKQQDLQEKLEEVVFPESRALVHDMVRNREIAVELLDASILPVAPPSSSSMVPGRSPSSYDNVSQVLADSKNVSNQQLVAAARKRQQLRQDKEALELELEELRQAATQARRLAERGAAAGGSVDLSEEEASLGVAAELVKEVKSMCLQGNMLLSDLRHEQKDNHIEDEDLPHDVVHVLEEMKEAISKTSKVLAGKLDMDSTVPSLTGEFEDVEIAVINLKMTQQGRGFERRGAFLKRSVRHLEDMAEEDEPGPVPVTSPSAASAKELKEQEELQRLTEEVQTNRAALAQLERRIQRMRVAVKQAESEAQSRGRVSSATASPGTTETSWTGPHGQIASAVEDENASVGSEFDSDAEDLAPASTLQLPRKSLAVPATVAPVAAGPSGPGVQSAAQATAAGTEGSTSAAVPGPPRQERPRPEAIVVPSLSQAEASDRKKALRALKQAKLVHEGLQEDIAALRKEIEQAQKSKGIVGEVQAGSIATVPASPTSPVSPGGVFGTEASTAGDPASPSNEDLKRSPSGRLAQLVRTHSGKLGLSEGKRPESSMSFSLIGNPKALDKHKRELDKQVKSLKQEVQKKKKLLMAMVPKDNLQDLINAGVFPGDQKTPTARAEENSVDKQVAALKNKLETLKKSVGFWQTRLENHVQKFNAMVEGPPEPKPGAVDSADESAASVAQSQQGGHQTPEASSSSRWKSTVSRMKSGSLQAEEHALDLPGVVMAHHKSDPQVAPGMAGMGGLPSLQTSPLQVSPAGRDGKPTGPLKATDLLGKLRRAGGLVANMQRGGVLHRSAHQAAHDREALHLSGTRRHSRDSAHSSRPGTGAQGAAGLAEVVPEGRHFANLSDLAQQAVQKIATEQETPPSPKKELTRSKAFTALKREVHLLTFAAHAQRLRKGKGRELAEENVESPSDPSRPHPGLEEHRPQELDDLEADSETFTESEDESQDDATPRTKMKNALMTVKMTNYLRQAAQRVRQEAKKVQQEASESLILQPQTPRLSVTQYARNLIEAAGLPLDDVDRLIDMMRLLTDEFLPFVYQQLYDMLSLPLHEQKTALKMLSLGHVDVSSPMRSKGEGAKSLGIASLLATQLLAMKQAAGLWDERNLQANALLQTLELDKEADAGGDLVIEEPDDESANKLLYRKARASMRGQKRRFVDASGRSFMSRSTVRRPRNKNTSENLELEGEHVDVHNRPALPSALGGHHGHHAIDPLSIDLESGIDPEELALLRRAQSWSLRPRVRQEVELHEAGSEGMKGYRRRASRDLDNYDSEFWDDMQEKIRVQKSELYEEIQQQRRDEWKKLGLDEDDESPRSSPSKTKGYRGNFQFGGVDKSKDSTGRFGRSKTWSNLKAEEEGPAPAVQKPKLLPLPFKLNLDPVSQALRRRFWLGNLAEEGSAAGDSSGSDNDGVKHSKSLGDLTSPRSLRRSSRRGDSISNQVDLSPRHLRGGLLARPMKNLAVAMNFANLRRSPSPGGFVKLEGGMVKFATDSPLVNRYDGLAGRLLRGKSKDKAFPGLERSRGLKDFRSGTGMFRRSRTAPGARQEAMSLYERSLTRKLLHHRPTEPSFSKNPAMRALIKKRKEMAQPMAKRMSQVRRGSLSHDVTQFRSLIRNGSSSARDVGSDAAPDVSISVLHYVREVPKGRRRPRQLRQPTKPRSVRLASSEDSDAASAASRVAIRPKLDGWTKRGATEPGAAAPWVPPAVVAAETNPTKVSPLVARFAAGGTAGFAASSVRIQEEVPPPLVTEVKEVLGGTSAANVEPKKMPLLPPRKMAEIPVDEASIRLRMNLMLFHRGRGDSPAPAATAGAGATPRQLPPLPGMPGTGPGTSAMTQTRPPLPMPDTSGGIHSPRSHGPPMPQFSSLKGGFTPKDLGGPWPQSARQNLGTRTTEPPDADSVSQKAREMLSYLQSFDRAPLQRLLSSRDGPRAKTDPRRPSHGDPGPEEAARPDSERLPPISKGGRHMLNPQAASWAQFLEERLGRHLRTLSKSTPPPPDVKSREIRSLLLD